MLLKVFSELLDGDLSDDLPRSILDAGSGTGVLGICAAGALSDLNKTSGFHVRCQDRDELGRIFTEHNARRNGFDENALSAWTEPLLAGLPDISSRRDAWDLILSNVPAKAGLPVLEDFVRRSTSLLNPNGHVLIVAVNTLADFFEQRINADAALIRKVKGPGHTVFLYGPPLTNPSCDVDSYCHSFNNEGLLKWNPAYLRNSADYEIEKTVYHLDTIHGAESFDEAGGEVLTAAKLAIRIEKKIFAYSGLRSGSSQMNVLVWEPDQGHFSTWFARRFCTRLCAGHDKLSMNACLNFVLAGRNILALDTAQQNTSAALDADLSDRTGTVVSINAVDLHIDSEKILRGKGFSFVAAFPETVPQTDRATEFWEGLYRVSLPGAVIIMGLPSTEAEKFDRAKQKGFTRLGDLRRKGFRALAYVKN